MEFDSYIIFSKHFEIESKCRATIDVVGQKAMGLLECVPEITPPFFIITAPLFKEWLLNKAPCEMILQNILGSLSNKFSSRGIYQFIVRSSAKFESFDERGFYKSSQGGIAYGDLLLAIKEVWNQNIEGFSKYVNNEFAIIVQQFVKPKLSGHLSNERRVSRNEPDWLLEIVSDKNEFQESGKFKAATTNALPPLSTLISKTRKELISNLKRVASTITRKEIRCHLEWVWDSKVAYIVQKDIEDNTEKGSTPGALWKRSRKIIDKKNLSSFNSVSTTNRDWKKVACIKTFINCNLPHGEVFILEDANLILNISNGEFDEILVNDLNWLLAYPIVIRMDIKSGDGYSNILLPRTETLYTIEQAKEFLIAKALEFLKQGLKSDEFCFLIHRFIISKSCALAFSRPNLEKARIDSTWGIVEGLYYHPHDSYEINLSNDPAQIKKQIRCKTEYIDIDETGKWFSKKAGTNWDWAESLNKQQVLDISEYNTIISDQLNSPVTVMYFVDVDQSTGYPTILPWFYTTEEITENSEKFTDVIFSGNRELIHSEADFNALQRRIGEEMAIKTTIKLKLNPEIFREKALIENIGIFAKSKNIPIELEGSILSHTYYILRKTGAKVKCINPFDPKYKKQRFYKLVRDKIPVNIELKGEKARTVKIDSGELLLFLKKKAIEEAYEFFWERENDKIIEELADIFEVIRASSKLFGIDVEELEHIANKKNEKKGGFESGIVLVDTTESSLIDVVDSKAQSPLIKDTEEGEIFLKDRAKIKGKKITFGTDNSITLPYIIGSDKLDGPELSVQIALEDVESIKIQYTQRGIKIRFIRRKESTNSRSQLSLF